MFSRLKSSLLFHVILQVITLSPEKKVILNKSQLSFHLQKRRGFCFTQRTICANTESSLFSDLPFILSLTSLLMFLYTQPDISLETSLPCSPVCATPSSSWPPFITNTHTHTHYWEKKLN